MTTVPRTSDIPTDPRTGAELLAQYGLEFNVHAEFDKIMGRNERYVEIPIFESERGDRVGLDPYDDGWRVDVYVASEHLHPDVVLKFAEAVALAAEVALRLNNPNVVDSRAVRLGTVPAHMQDRFHLVQSQPAEEEERTLLPMVMAFEVDHWWFTEKGPRHIGEPWFKDRRHGRHRSEYTWLGDYTATSRRLDPVSGETYQLLTPLEVV